MTKIEPDTKYYHYHNENPKNRKTGDCVIRSIATATGISWDETLDGLVDIAHKLRYAPTSVEGFDRYLTSIGWFKVKCSYKYDRSRYSGTEFCKYLENNFPNHKSIIANIGSHHTTCFIKEENDNWRCYDIWNPTDFKVGNFWINKSV